MVQVSGLARARPVVQGSGQQEGPESKIGRISAHPDSISVQALRHGSAERSNSPTYFDLSSVVDTPS